MPNLKPYDEKGKHEEVMPMLNAQKEEGMKLKSDIDAAKTAARIAAQPLGALKAAKEAALAAQNTPLEEGIAFERKAAQCCLAADEFRESLRNFAAGQK